MKMKLLRLWAFISTIFFVAVIAGSFGFLLHKAVPQLSVELVFGDTPPLEALFGNAPVWDALWPPIIGTLHLLVTAMLFILPLGIAAGAYLAEYAPARFRNWVTSVLEIFAGIPSIVMGLFGFLLILLLRKSFLPHAGTSLLLAAFCLSLLVLPVFILTFQTALRNTPHSLRVTAAAIGLSHNTSVWRIFVPHAGRGLVSAFCLASGRCAEDTAVILMTGAIANASRAPFFTDKFEALPFYIYYTTANYQNEAEFLRVFAAAFFLLLLACILLMTGGWLRSVAFKDWNTL